MTQYNDVACDYRYVKYLDHGFVGLINLMGDDYWIDNIARVSYGGNAKPRTNEEVTNLIRYLYRNRHTSPFEMVEILFHIKMPIFVMRQHVRHRTASLNEYSGRYSVMSNEFYCPDENRVFGQSESNKQQSEGELPKNVKDEFFNNLKFQHQSAYYCYQQAIENGVSRELARIQLPVSNYTELYWKIDLHNFFHYVGLRNDPKHAQSEIVELAQLMYELVKPHVPISCQAFEDYKFNAVSFSSIEQKILAEVLKIDEWVQGNMDDTLNKHLKGRELEEFKKKISKIIEKE